MVPVVPEQRQIEPALRSQKRRVAGVAGAERAENPQNRAELAVGEVDRDPPPRARVVSSCGG
jgi:hypothetical protein